MNPVRPAAAAVGRIAGLARACAAAWLVGMPCGDGVPARAAAEVEVEVEAVYVLEDLALPVPAGGAGSEGFRLGGLSDLARGDGPDRLWAVTDRGPNGLFAEKRGRSKDARRTLPVPGFVPLLVELALVPAPAGGAGTLRVLRTLPIVDARGTPASGRPVGGDNQRPLLHPTTGVELPWDPLGLDPEGLVRLPGGGFWVAEEYVPSLLELAADGTIRGRFTPAGSGGQDVLPAAYARRRDNRGFEALACTPDGALVYCLLQSPIDGDAEKRRRSRNVRLLVFDAARRRPVAEHFYRLGRPKDERRSDRDQDADGKVSAAAWAGPGRLLVLEQSEKDSRIYAVDLSGATDTLARPGQQTFDAVEPLEEAGVKPVQKTRVVDLELFARRFQADIDPAAGERMKPADLKFEGMAVLGGGRIAIVNDNDFDIGADGATPRSPPGRRTCVWILRSTAMPRP